MMKIGTVLLFLLTFTKLSFSITLNCFEEHRYYGLPGILSCVVAKNFTILTKNQQIQKITGIKKQSTIYGFTAEQATIHYIPYGIGSHLTEIKNVVIKNSSLKEVTSENLKQFPNLIYLDLSFNQIKILNKDVFQHSQKLTDLHLNNNQIFAIEVGAFNMFKESLIKLKFLNLHGSNCEFSLANKRNAVLAVIERMDGKCWNETSKMKFDIYKNQEKIERIEIENGNLREMIMNFSKSDECQDLPTTDGIDLYSMLNTSFQEIAMLKETIQNGQNFKEFLTTFTLILSSVSFLAFACNFFIVFRLLY